MTNTTAFHTCRYCGDHIFRASIDTRGEWVRDDVNGEAWINRDEESMCAPHDDDDLCEFCEDGEGHDHTPEG